VEVIFAYPGGASMEFTSRWTTSRSAPFSRAHEQGGSFAAEGYAA